MLATLVRYLPAPLRPAAKTVVTALGGLSAVIAHGVLTGQWDTAALELAATALIAALVYGTPNTD